MYTSPVAVCTYLGYLSPASLPPFTFPCRPPPPNFQASPGERALSTTDGWNYVCTDGKKEKKKKTGMEKRLRHVLFCPCSVQGRLEETTTETLKEKGKGKASLSSRFHLQLQAQIHTHKHPHLRNYSFALTAGA